MDRKTTKGDGMVNDDGRLLDVLLADIAEDRAAERFAGWAHSTLVDETVGAPVLPVATARLLSAAAGLPDGFPVGNAGLWHVYGYLLSEVPTPYGLKRERWLGGDLATALGLPRDAFVPAAHPGTLLARVTAAVSPVLEHAAADGADLLLAHREDLPGAATGVTGVVRADSAGPAALCYGLHEAGRLRIVTAFPYSGRIDDLRREFDRGARVRWNGVLSG